MRLIRQLPLADAAAPTKFRRERSWSVLQGALFAIGLTLLGVGLARAAYYQWARSTLSTQETPWNDLTGDLQTIDAWNIDQTWEAWKKMRVDSVGPFAPPVFIMHRFISAYWFTNVVGGLRLAGVGFLALLSAFIAGFVTKPRARRAIRPASFKR